MEQNRGGLLRYSRSQCAQCETVSQVEQYHGLDLSRYPDGKERLLEGKFFQWRCPKCGLEADTAWPCWYFDPEERLGISLVPGLDSSGAGEVLQAMNQNLENLALPGMKHRVAGNFFAMQEIVRVHDAGLDDRAVQLVKPIIIGQLQSAGKVVWNGFFQGVSIPEAGTEPIQGVLYASIGPKTAPEYGQPIYWYDIHLTSRTVIHAGVNEPLFQMCLQMLERLELPPDDGAFQLYDLNWAIRCHDRIQNS